MCKFYKILLFRVFRNTFMEKFYLVFVFVKIMIFDIHNVEFFSKRIFLGHTVHNYNTNVFREKSTSCKQQLALFV